MGGLLAFLRGLFSDLSSFWGGADTIRIVNSNICNLDIDDCVGEVNTENNVTGVTNIDILDGMVEKLVSLKKVGQPNIYALQEVDKEHSRTDNRDVARDIEETLEGGVFGGDLDGVWKAYEHIHKPWHVSKLGDALFSNGNLENHFVWDLSSHCPVGSELGGDRNAIGAYLSELSLPLWVITLHLSWDDEEGRWQLKNLLHRLGRLRDNDLVLVVGDFNIHRTEEVTEFNEMVRDFECLGYEYLGGASVDHAFLRDARNQLVDKTVEVIDRFWQINGQQVMVTDHRLLVIDLSWPRRQVLSF